MIALYIVIAVLAVILVLWLTAAHIIFRMAFYRNGSGLVRLFFRNIGPSPYDEYADILNAGTAWIETQPHEDLYITSFDGLRLHGRYIENKAAERIIICMHGYHGSAKKDFAGCAQEMGRTASLLLIDQRAHGESEGKYLTLGINESRDCAEWVRLMSSKSDLPIYLCGVSMGSASVLSATALVPSDAVKGVIADCGFTSVRAIIEKLIRSTLKIPPRPIADVIKLYCRLFIGIDMDSSCAIDAMRSCEIPVAFFHGEADGFVPCYMTRENYEACASEKIILTVPGASHCLSYLLDTPAYLGRLRELFALCERGEESEGWE